MCSLDLHLKQYLALSETSNFPIQPSGKLNYYYIRELTYIEFEEMFHSDCVINEILFALKQTLYILS